MTKNLDKSKSIVKGKPYTIERIPDGTIGYQLKNGIFEHYIRFGEMGKGWGVVTIDAKLGHERGHLGEIDFSDEKPEDKLDMAISHCMEFSATKKGRITE
jgi:hypothetical protein